MVFANNEVESLSANEAVNTDAFGRKQKNERKSCVPDTNSNADKEDLLKLFMEVCGKLGQQANRTAHFMLTNLEGKQIIDRFAQWCAQNPKLALCVLAAALVTCLPILMFMAFALSSFVLTFTGFLVLEGTILTVITMITFGLLGALGIFLLFCTFIGLATYFGVSHAYNMYESKANQRQDLRNFKDKYKNIISVPNTYRSASDNDLLK